MLWIWLSALCRFFQSLRPAALGWLSPLEASARVVVPRGKPHFQGFLHSADRNTMHSAVYVVCVCVNKVEVIMTPQK